MCFVAVFNLIYCVMLSFSLNILLRHHFKWLHGVLTYDVFNIGVFNQMFKIFELFPIMINASDEHIVYNSKQNKTKPDKQENIL